MAGIASYEMIVNTVSMAAFTASGTFAFTSVLTQDRKWSDAARVSALPVRVSSYG
jgi:hypothetical protein